MSTLTATEARKRLYTLVDEVAESHDPIQIVGKRNSAVLLSEEDWRTVIVYELQGSQVPTMHIFPNAGCC